MEQPAGLKIRTTSTTTTNHLHSISAAADIQFNTPNT
jgi:hypothetical protein